MVKIIFYILTALYLIQSLWHYRVLPARIASNFNAQGEVNSTMPKTMLWIIQIAPGLFILACFLFSLWAISQGKTQGLSIPHKEHWVRPENLAQLRAILSTAYWQFGCGYLLYHISMAQLLFSANMGTGSLNMRLFMGMMLLAALALVYWIVLLYKALQI